MEKEFTTMDSNKKPIIRRRFDKPRIIRKIKYRDKEI
jgi:hypothetical protein